MNNNFDEKEVDRTEQDTPIESDNGAGEETSEAEHVISYRDEIPRSETYVLRKDEIIKDEPIYGADPSVIRKDTKDKHTALRADVGKKKGSVLKKAALVALCVLLSFGSGIGGAALWLASYDGNAGTDSDGLSAGPDKTVVIDRVVEHVETSSEGSALTYSDVEALVGDSVVAITTEHKVTSFWQEYVTSGAGSGVVISEDGYIVTNNHVIATEESSFYGTTTSYADKITVSFKNGNEYEAEIVGSAPSADIAVIKIEPREDDQLVTAKFADSDKLKVGEEVIAIGNPLGELSGTTTNGIISALARKVTVENVEMNLLQTNAAINPGNSGGGLFNMSGELVGVVNAKSSGTGIEGLGFAIPSNDAYNTAKKIIETGGVITNTASVKIGITTVNIFTAADAQKYNVNVYGVYVYEVEEGFNDEVLKSGDRIIAVNGEEIGEGADVVSIVRAASAGDELEFAIYRGGKFMTVKVMVYDNTSADNVDF